MPPLPPLIEGTAYRVSANFTTTLEISTIEETPKYLDDFTADLATLLDVDSDIIAVTAMGGSAILRTELVTQDAAAAHRATVLFESPPESLGEIPISHVTVEPISVGLLSPPPSSSSPSPPLDVNIGQDDAGQNLIQGDDGESFNLLHVATSGSSWTVYAGIGGIIVVVAFVVYCSRRCRHKRERNRMLVRNRTSPNNLKFVQLTHPEDQMAPLTALQRQHTQHGTMPLNMDTSRMAPYTATGLPGGGPYGGPANLDSSKLRATASPGSRRLRGDTRERGLSEWSPAAGLMPASAQLFSTKL